MSTTDQHHSNPDTQHSLASDDTIESDRKTPDPTSTETHEECTTGPTGGADFALDASPVRPLYRPPVVDGAGLQRRKRGLISASQQPKNVVPFPSASGLKVPDERHYK